MKLSVTLRNFAFAFLIMMTGLCQAEEKSPIVITCQCKDGGLLISVTNQAPTTMDYNCLLEGRGRQPNEWNEIAWDILDTKPPASVPPSTKVLGVLPRKQALCFSPLKSNKTQYYYWDFNAREQGMWRVKVTYFSHRTPEDWKICEKKSEEQQKADEQVVYLKITVRE